MRGGGWYRWLLLLYPAAFRRRFGADMEDLFADRMRAARQRGPAARLGEWFAASLDAITHALVERRRQHRRNSSMISSILQDLRFGMTGLRRSPGFAALAILSLALGIGATTALFAATRIALINDLHVSRPDELRLVHWWNERDLAVSQYNSGQYTDPATNRRYRTNFSYGSARTLQTAFPDRVFSFNFLPRLSAAFDGQPPVAVTGLLASGNAFDVLRVPVAFGRGLIVADDNPSAPPAVVLTHDCWTTLFGADRGILGRAVHVNGSSFTIVGVTARGFSGLSTGGGFTPLAQFIFPISAQPLVWAPRDSFSAANVLWLRVMTRVPEAERSRLTEQLTATLRGSLRETGLLTASEANGAEVLLRPGRRGVDPIAPFAERPLRILSIVVIVVVLIACVNIAALLLARGLNRQREMAVRQALGAGRLRLIRQLVLESTVLAAAGGAAGVLVAFWARPLVTSMLTAGLGVPPAGMTFDAGTLAVALGATAFTAAAFGLLPAVRLTRGDAVAALRQSMIAAGAKRKGVGRGLLALQIAGSVPLVVLALLLIRTMVNLGAVNVGFDPDDLLIVRVNQTAGASRVEASDPRGIEVRIRGLLRRIEAVPGVSSATVVENPLLSGIVSNNWAYVDGERISLYMNGVGPRYFETLGVPLLAGRAPGLNDHADGPRVAVINETAARKYFGGAGSAVGRRFTMGKREYEVVGVAADTKYQDVRDDVEPTMMDPFVQRAGSGSINILVRSARQDTDFRSDIRQAVAEALPDLPIAQIRTQAEEIARLSGRERILTQLLSFFATFVLLLASVGLYSATAYAVARRTSEIGLRMALGARRPQVVWMIVQSVLGLSVVGLALGLLAGWFAAPLAEAMLFELEPHDPVTLLLAAALMLTVSLAAALLPALRASRIDPLTALRTE